MPTLLTTASSLLKCSVALSTMPSPLEMPLSGAILRRWSACVRPASAQRVRSPSQENVLVFTESEVGASLQKAQHPTQTVGLADLTPLDCAPLVGSYAHDHPPSGSPTDMVGLQPSIH